MIRLFHRLVETPWIYSLTQMLGRPTVERYHAFVRKYVPQEKGRRVLEIGCGTGSARPLFAGDYTGIDINPGYIGQAQRNFAGTFQTMDAGALPFAPKSFDDAVTIATCHHLSDLQLASMVAKAVTVAGHLHIIDAILPLSARSVFKRAWFRMDRGQFVRTFEQLSKIVGDNADIDFRDVVEGPLHDVAYIRASRRG